MDVFGVVVNIVLILLTAVVVYFAWQTVREARDAGKAAEETVTSLKELLTATNETAALLARSAEAANETAAIAKATRDQAKYDQERRALMNVEELAERIFWQAAEASGYEAMTGWRCADQNYLGQALVRVEIPLPASRRLVEGLGTAEGVMGAARRAQQEAALAIRQLRQQSPA